MMKKYLIYSFTALAVLSVIFLSISYWFIRAAWLDTLYQTNDLTGPTVTNTTTVAIDDPLITIVPTDQQSPEQKTKVFISSLDPISGENSAKVFVIMYGSLLDSDSQTYVQLVPELAQKYSPSEVAFIWKDYGTDDSAKQAAMVGHCVNEQNRFWEYAGALPNRTGDDTAAFITLAATIGASTADLEECVANAGYDAQVQQSHYAGEVLGVHNGHTLFINDRLYSELISSEQITQTIDEILATYQ